MLTDTILHTHPWPSDHEDTLLPALGLSLVAHNFKTDGHAQMHNNAAGLLDMRHAALQLHR